MPLFRILRLVLLLVVSIVTGIIFIVTTRGTLDITTLLPTLPIDQRQATSNPTLSGTWDNSSWTSPAVDVRNTTLPSGTLPAETVVQVVTVMCGARQKEGMVMLKSLASLTTAPVMLHVFCLPSQHTSLENTLRSWPQNIQRRVQHQLYNATMPPEWQKQGWIEPRFRPCSTQRLYLPDLLPDVDAVLYLDSDLLLLAPVEELWAMFSGFNSSQLIGLALETLHPSLGWYSSKTVRHPFVLPAGVNTGVTLMNLTRLRASAWRQELVRHSHTYRNKLPLGDQDIINVYLHFHPEQAKILGCSVNYRSDFCQDRRNNPNSVCKEAEDHGAFILHGNRQALLDMTLGFNPVYDGFKKYVMGGDLRQTVKEMETKMNSSLPCNEILNTIFKRLHEAVTNQLLRWFQSNVNSRP